MNGRLRMVGRKRFVRAVLRLLLLLIILVIEI